MIKVALGGFRINLNISYKFLGTVAGVLSGLVVPLCFLLKMRFHNQASIALISAEISKNYYYSAYILFIIPSALGWLGAYLGGFHDKQSHEKSRIENLMNALAAQSMSDDVTGLYNHRHLIEEIEREIERAKRYDHILCGMMIDVDGFKKINDTYGHLTGDFVLREMAQLLIQSLRKIDVIGRYGGDEFVVILPETRIEAAIVVAERILQNVRQHRFQTKHAHLSLTVSIGIISFENIKDLDRAQFIERIDKAMFEAKALGKDRIFK